MKKKFQKLYPLLLFIFIVSCEGNKNPCNLSKEVLKDIDRIDSMFKTHEVKYTNFLKNNFKEPSIFNYDCETYRFILSDSWYGEKVYRIENRGNKYKAIVKVFDRHDTAGKFKEFYISKDVWNNITDSLKLTNFWIYPNPIDRRILLDGSYWSLEGYKPIKDKCTLKNYHCVHRQSPSDKQFISMCKLLYKLK